MKARIKNFAPDSDMIVVTVGACEVVVSYDEDRRAIVSVIDHNKGSEIAMVLGEWGATKKKKIE